MSASTSERSATAPARSSSSGVTKRFGDVTAVRRRLDHDPGRRVLLDARPERVRQDDHPAHDRGLRGARRRPHRAAGRRRDPRAAAEAQREHGVPGLRAVPAHDGGGEHRVRPEDQEVVARGDRASGWPRRSAPCSSTGSRTGDRGSSRGGQQQRVALARALVNRPAALLLDEPLGALDLKLRKEMQLELKDLQQRTGTTFVYVTHDQEEAMTMSDRIAVMNGGVVEQLATPQGAVPAARERVRGRVHRHLEPDRAAGRPARGRAADDGPRRRAAHPGGRARAGCRRPRRSGRRSPCGPSGSSSRPARWATAPATSAAPWSTSSTSARSPS